VTERFTIRPVLGAEECLTSYLLRISSQNFVDLTTIWRACKNDTFNKVGMERIYYFDTYPVDLVIIDTLAFMLNLSQEKLLHNTFQPIIKRFFGADKAAKQLLSFEIETKHRRFCSICLKETGQFNMLWQVKEISMCDKHFTLLTDTCSNCSCKLKYLHSNFMEYKCSNCNESLFNQKNYYVGDQSTIKTEIRYYQDWRSLLNQSEQHQIMDKNGALNYKRLVLVLLYLSNYKPNQSWGNDNKCIINRSQVEKFLSMVRGRKNAKITLSSLLIIIRKLDMTLSELFTTQVPLSYIRSILKNNNKKVGACLTPWCKYRGTKKKLKVISEHAKRKKLKGVGVYSKISICTSCWMKFGFCRNNEKWESMFGDLGKIEKVRILYNKGIPKYKIPMLSGISPYSLEYYLGYLFYNNLVSNYFMRDFNDYLNSNEKVIIEVIDCLGNYVKHFEKFRQKGKEILGWNRDKVFTAYWHPKFQEYNLSQYIKREIKLEKKSKIKAKTEEILKKTDKEVTMKEVSSLIGVNDSVLLYYGLNKLVSEHNSDKKKKRLKKEEEEIIKRLQEFIDFKNKSMKQIFTYEMYEHIERTSRYCKTNLPCVVDYISKATKESKEMQDIKTYEKLKEVIIYLYTNQIKVNNKNISKYMNLSVHYVSSNRGVFNGLSTLISDTLEELGTK
jgi:hypothetical protein